MANLGVNESRMTTASSRIGCGGFARYKISWTRVGEDVRREADVGIRLLMCMAGPGIVFSHVTRGGRCLCLIGTRGGN